MKKLTWSIVPRLQAKLIEIYEMVVLSVLLHRTPNFRIFSQNVTVIEGKLVPKKAEFWTLICNVAGENPLKIGFLGRTSKSVLLFFFGGREEWNNSEHLLVRILFFILCFWRLKPHRNSGGDCCFFFFFTRGSGKRNEKKKNTIK